MYFQSSYLQIYLLFIIMAQVVYFCTIFKIILFHNHNMHGAIYLFDTEVLLLQIKEHYLLLYNVTRVSTLFVPTLLKL